MASSSSREVSHNCGLFILEQRSTGPSYPVILCNLKLACKNCVEVMDHIPKDRMMAIKLEGKCENFKALTKIEELLGFQKVAKVMDKCRKPFNGATEFLAGVDLKQEQPASLSSSQLQKRLSKLLGDKIHLIMKRLSPALSMLTTAKTRQSMVDISKDARFEEAFYIQVFNGKEMALFVTRIYAAM